MPWAETDYICGKDASKLVINCHAHTFATLSLTVLAVALWACTTVILRAEACDASKSVEYFYYSHVRYLTIKQSDLPLLFSFRPARARAGDPSLFAYPPQPCGRGLDPCAADEIFNTRKKFIQTTASFKSIVIPRRYGRLGGLANLFDRLRSR